MGASDTEAEEARPDKRIEAQRRTHRREGRQLRVGESRDETEAERLDRNYNELLQELRVTQTGTQILFAFLLTIAFTRVFADSDRFTHVVYSMTLVACAVATAFLIAPVALHRTLFRRGLKEDIVVWSNRFAIVGVYVLLGAVLGALVLALDVVLTRGTAITISAAVATLTVGLWVVLPVTVRVRER
ncbi:DUF6328 family protein [Aquipuribacter nitratireducens]|uniref:DUF6328 family protein n=1 Tax=Aquipuribacter nitratireducens TaxID=650104 RepID=A0ABW0GPQ7_9MICO